MVGRSFLTLALFAAVFPVRGPARAAADLTRRYRDGEAIRYRLSITNQGPAGTAQSALTASGTVRKDAGGRFVEEIGWTDVTVAGAPFALPAASAAFRERLSLDPGAETDGTGDLTEVRPVLLGPIADLATFYTDLRLARAGTLAAPGDHFHVKGGQPTSWADGRRAIVAEDSVDFDVTLQRLDQAARTATVGVRHVPADPPQIKVPTEWMRDPVADTPNNWVEVEPAASGRFSARVGEETVDVTLTISLADGHLIGATLARRVQVLERQCSDGALRACGPPVTYELAHHVDLTSR